MSKKQKHPSPSASRPKAGSQKPLAQTNGAGRFAGLRRILAIGVLGVAILALAWAGNLFLTQGTRPVVAPTIPPTVTPIPTVNRLATPTTPLPTATPRPSVRVDRIKGNPAARVTITEFSDFQCPYCALYATQIYPQLDEKYIKTGKVKYLFRPIVLPQHRQAQKATEAAECAGDQGRYWEMHDLLFAQQSLWAEKPDAVNTFKGFAQKLGLDGATFQQCLDSGKYANVPTENAGDARRLGVTGTPTFIIGNRILPGAYPLETFVQLIEEELAK